MERLHGHLCSVVNLARARIIPTGRVKAIARRSVRLAREPRVEGLNRVAPSPVAGRPSLRTAYPDLNGRRLDAQSQAVRP